MSYISYFSPPPNQSELSDIVLSPFSNNPGLLALRASAQLQQRLKTQTDWNHDFEAADGGKMFGVLVVKNGEGAIGFISAFSGMLAGSWSLPGFVPPVFNQMSRDSFLPTGEAELAAYGEQITRLQDGNDRLQLMAELQLLASQRDSELQTLDQAHIQRKAQRDDKRASITSEDKTAILGGLALESQRDKSQRRKLSLIWEQRLTSVQVKLTEIEQQIEELKRIRVLRSRELHSRVFAGYELTNWGGEKLLLSTFFDPGMPPGGAGDCAAPKLLHFAHQHGLTPLSIAEFWWGASPVNGVRHHRQFYPACRGKCHPILPFMLKGLPVRDRFLPGADFADDDAPYAVYEDAHLVVVNKPEGLLSVPGKEVSDSVLSRMRVRYPDATGPLLLHRLDLATSGLLIVAKTSAVHKSLQRQFLDRTIEKRYVAIVSKRLDEDSGIIELPLRVDINDRPRQQVCFSHGKSAVTRWEVIEREDTATRVYFYPVTGRTHQLRVHAAHKKGLNAPILGDRLYGSGNERMFLHAQRLQFTHPVTGKRIEVEVQAPF